MATRVLVSRLSRRCSPFQSIRELSVAQSAHEDEFSSHTGLPGRLLTGIVASGSDRDGPSRVQVHVSPSASRGGVSRALTGFREPGNPSPLGHDRAVPRVTPQGGEELLRFAGRVRTCPRTPALATDASSGTLNLSTAAITTRSLQPSVPAEHPSTVRPVAHRENSSLGECLAWSDEEVVTRVFSLILECYSSH